jgi:hypothetical protein
MHIFALIIVTRTLTHSCKLHCISFSLHWGLATMLSYASVTCTSSPPSHHLITPMSSFICPHLIAQHFIQSSSLPPSTPLSTPSPRTPGFAGPAVILNTMCEADQTKFDKQCPADFQCAQYVLDHGTLQGTDSR